MVGITMTANSHERLAGLMDSAIFASDIPSKLDRLCQSKRDLVRQQDPDLLSELLPRFFELQSDRMLGEIGLMHVQLLPEIVRSLINVLSDGTPAVARQAITTAIHLFRCVLEKVSIQGLHASELDSLLESASAWVLKLKDEIYSIAFRPGSGGVRLRALKFVESVILLYTPDPNGFPAPPAHEGDLVDFNVSWLRGGHPLLNVGDLSVEASKSLGLLLDQLRFPTVKSLGSLVIVVLINSLINGVHVSGPHHALKNAFLTCLKCTHQGATPDVEILIPILPFLPKDEVMLIFPQLVNLQLDKFQAALARTLQGSSQSGPLLAPAEILIAIHGIDPDKDGIPLKKVTDACNACFEQRKIFTQQVIAKVLNQLVEQIPLPLLFMRTVLQGIGAFPALILSRLVSKQIWKYPKLWVGFLKCAFLTKPQSFAALLQLPPVQLENALKRTADSPAPTSQFQAEAPTSQFQAEAQTSQSQAGDASNLEKGAVTEKSKESYSAI